MEKLQVTITTANGETLFAEVRPEDERKLAELLGDRSSIQFAPSQDDLEGHAMSSDIVVDVEGHAMAIRLPRPSDAAAVRRALAVGAVTATIVGAGVVAGLRPAAQTAPAVEIPIHAPDVFGHVLLDAHVGGPRFVDVHDLEIRVGGRERIQHAPTRLLHVELQRRDEIEPAHQIFRELARVACRATKLVKAEGAGRGAEQCKGNEERSRASPTHERAHPFDHCACTSSR